MPIKVPDSLPARATLEGENIFVMTEYRAMHQDMRPLNLLILNLMPTKIVTETQLLRKLSNSPLQVQVELLHTSSHVSQNTDADHLSSFYTTFDQIKDRKYDGMIITGAPVENLDFTDVDYWDELCQIMEWTRTHVHSTLHICWGAQAGLYYHYNIPKYSLPSKLFGVFPHTLIRKQSPLFRGFDDVFYVPHSRYTTNHLEEIAANLFNREIEQAHDRITRLEFQFIEFANGLLTYEKLKREAIDYILDRFQQLWKFTKDSFTSVEEKEVLAQGELISTALMHFYLRELKIPNALLCAFDFMRIGPDNEPDLEYIEQKLREQLACHPGINLFITQGFICKNAYNETDNLKRGGSDYTASLIGTALQADEIQIWTDIDGMHNNDPREVSGTRPVKRLSFNEAEQLAFYGAKILHPFCIAPARLRNIPVRLLNSMEPSAEGTLISNLQDDNIIKAIAAKDHIIYIKFESNHNLCPYLFISKIFDIFAKYRTPLCLLVSSNLDVSVAIDDCTRLSNIISELRQYAHVLVEDRMTIVSVVGNMQWEYAGFEAKIMEALKDIPLRMISYGSSNNDVAFVIKNTDKKRALQALNDKLFQPEYAERN